MFFANETCDKFTRVPVPYDTVLSGPWIRPNFIRIRILDFLLKKLSVIQSLNNTQVNLHIYELCLISPVSLSGSVSHAHHLDHILLH
jgi:hypothetical protein